MSGDPASRDETAAVRERPITLTRAARALGVATSTLSRYLAKFPHLNAAPAGRRPRVLLSELRAHRAANVDPAHQPIADSDRAAAARRNGVVSFEELRIAKAKEEVAKLETERRRRDGELVERAAVERSVFACFRRVRRKVELVELWADDLAAACDGDAAALRAAIKARLRPFQDELAEAVKALLPDPDDDDAPDEAGHGDGAGDDPQPVNEGT